METTTQISPKEITFDPECNLHMASFGYYDGVAYCKQNNLQQTIRWGEVMNKTHFIVCCGDVMIKCEETDWPEIERRTI